MTSNSYFICDCFFTFIILVISIFIILGLCGRDFTITTLTEKSVEPHHIALYIIIVVQ